VGLRLRARHQSDHGWEEGIRRRELSTGSWELGKVKDLSKVRRWVRSRRWARLRRFVSVRS